MLMVYGADGGYLLTACFARGVAGHGMVEWIEKHRLGWIAVIRRCFVISVQLLQPRTRVLLCEVADI